MNWKRGSIALVLSILQPGLGHIYTRRLRLAVGILIAQPCLLLLLHFAVRSRFFWGLTVTLLAGIFFQLLVIVHAAREGLRQRAAVSLPSAKGALLIVALVLAALNITGSVSNFYSGRLVGIRAFRAAGESMAPTLREGDRIIADLNAYRASLPRRQDVVVYKLRRPGGATAVFIKRVVAVGGDTVEGTPEGIVLNGELLAEPYLNPPDSDSGLYRNFAPRLIPPGEFFLLGDNRDNSYDSRYTGNVKLADIEYKPLFIYWSTDHSRIGRPIR